MPHHRRHHKCGFPNIFKTTTSATNGAVFLLLLISTLMIQISPSLASSSSSSSSSDGNIISPITLTHGPMKQQQQQQRQHYPKTRQSFLSVQHHNYNPYQAKRILPLQKSNRNSDNQLSSLTVLLQLLRGGSSSSSFPPPRTPPTTTFPTGANTPSQQRQQQRQQAEINEEEEPEVKNGVTTKEMIDAFLTRGSRNKFIARVYAILTGQLLVTACSCLLFGIYPPLANFRYHMHNMSPILSSIPLIGIVVSTIAWIRICTSVTARRKSPNKWVWLSLYTIGESIAVGFISSLYSLRSVLSAMGATALATFTVSAYTILQTNPKYDLSQWGATLSSWTMILLAYVLLGALQQSGIIPFEIIPYSDMAYSGFACLLFTAFLAYDTKLIVGGKHTKYRMTDKDYVFGAMSLYTDIINIFLNLLQLMGEEKS